MPKTLNQQLGQWGEEMASKYLQSKGYSILDRNFRRKWGEIDIICLISNKNKENKTNNVPRGTFLSRVKNIFKGNNKNVPRGTKNTPTDKVVFVEVKTLQSKLLRPEENVTPNKQKRIIRSCQLYLEANNYSVDTDWQIDVIGILLDKNTGKAKIEHIEQAVYFN